MSPLLSLTQTIASNTITTTATLPHPTSSILTILHTPNLPFKLNPYLTTFQAVNDSGEYEAIEITPFSLLGLKLSLTVKMHVLLKLTDDGFVADVNASSFSGMAKTKVQSAFSASPHEGGCKIEERFTVSEAPWGWWGYVLRTAGKGNLEKFETLGGKIEEAMGGVVDGV